MINTLSNIYEKPSKTNKVFLIRYLVNLNMKECSSMTDHVHELSLIILRLISVDIGFYNVVWALLLLSSFPISWFGIVKIVNNSYGSANLTFEVTHDLILGEDLCRLTIREASITILSTKYIEIWSHKGGKDRGRSKLRKKGGHINMRDVTRWNYKESGHFINQCLKPLVEKKKKKKRDENDSK